MDLRIENGVVAELGDGLPESESEVIDADGLVVCPGLIDVHVHLREPGGEHKETIASGVAAAAAGGFTSIVAMPNTDPPIDNPAAVGFVLAEGRRIGLTRVYPSGAITVGQKGEQLTEVGEMVQAGAVTITDDGRPVRGAGVMRLALEYAQTFDLPVAVHEEETDLSRGGVMNEGIISSRLGLTGIPNAAEDVMIARDLLLTELTGGRLHVQHVSTVRGVDMIQRAKERGIRVTAEATPHHFTLTDAAVEQYRTDAKMNPPLRSEADREAVRAGVRDGTLDVIATDHAPHHYDEKEQAFDDAPFGIVGLETALGLGITELVEKRVIDLPTLIERMSCNPARALSLPGGTLARGKPGDVALFHLEREWVVDPSRFRSLSRNTPFADWKLRGQPIRTIVGGRSVWFRRED
ncbi:MAG: amidohydrolase family protein [Gemmatimonas sp.]|nr:amidohydrolase family protein [Gemmatimonas sp.]